MPRLRFLLLSLVLSVLPAPLAAQDDRPSLEHYNLDKKGLAIDGYDPVTYFKEGGGKPRKGEKSITTAYRGVTYRFRNEANRDLFLATPGRYEPAYGGWCAWAMSADDPSKVEIDPKSYLIEEGRLLLFYDGFFADTRKRWLKAGGENQKPKADAYWSEVTGEGPGRDLLHWSLEQGVALGGFDPTAYRAGKAVAGKQEHRVLHDGVTYHFATAEGMEAFKRSPESYEAGYGGWCARAMAAGQKVAADPKVFVVSGEDLFVFAYPAARDEWVAAEARLRPEADDAWKRLQASRQ